MPPIEALKESFLKENSQFSELEEDYEAKSIGKFEDIDLAESEVWFLQCPKGTDVKLLEQEKIKIPGRTNLSNVEAVSVEFVEGKQQHSFAYCHRKGGFDLRLLPVRGTIVLRNRLKATDTISAERVEECCPPLKKVPMPSTIRIRHPLLGFQYEDKLNISRDVLKRLKEADNVSADLLKIGIMKKYAKTIQASNHKAPENENTNETSCVDEDDAVQFVKEEILPKKKRKKSESRSKMDASVKKNRKSKTSDDDNVSKDLQWLQNI
ncbi:uncharacterized protein LOC106091971 [Stomoxys calcitrans]|uniref:Uncharacterized protein n=1 Tax=Stomoxys calcitrans TaxID=35570 RepID=A0A1I8NYF5_STOCA|nr:uncharacterized protein LOC106091971 [Stomoxys calcitrans]